MTVVFLVVVVIKSIPKCKLPYCLGGTKGIEETFVCYDRYKHWCDTHRLVPAYNQQTLSNMTSKDVKKIAEKTLERNRRPINGVKPDF
jgi:hypothetical protein